MARPPVLPALDWPAVFASALTWESWLGTAEKAEHRDLLRRSLHDLILDETAGSRLARLPRKVHVLAIAETWCGDVRRHAPTLQRLADAGDRVDVRFLLIARGKAAGLYPEARKRVAERYAADPGRCEEISEILSEIEIAAATEL